MSLKRAGEFSLRQALPEDAADIAALHVAVWRKTYLALAPDEAFRRLDEPLRRASWQAYLNHPQPGQFVVLAFEQNRLAGFGMLAPSVRSEFAGRHEVKHLYVAEHCHGRGIGRGLLRAMAQEALKQGSSGIALGVVDGNRPAVAFYEHLGGICTGRYLDAGPLWKSANLVYVWDDLESLSNDGDRA